MGASSCVARCVTWMRADARHGLDYKLAQKVSRKSLINVCEKGQRVKEEGETGIKHCIFYNNEWKLNKRKGIEKSGSITGGNHRSVSKDGVTLVVVMKTWKGDDVQRREKVQDIENETSRVWRNENQKPLQVAREIEAGE